MEAENDPQDALTDLCQKMLEGKLGIIIGSRQIRDLAFKYYHSDAMPKEFDPFIGIDCEAGNLPLGPERRHWSLEALKRKDEELAELEKRFRDLAFQSCRNLIQAFSKRNT